MDEGDALPEEEEEPRRSSSSSSDAHDVPLSCSCNDDGVEDDGGRSGGSSNLQKYVTVMSENGPALKADTTSDDMGEMYPATTPVATDQHGHSENLDPEDGIFNSENTIMSSTMGGIPKLSARNLPNDQLVQALVNVQQPNYDIPEPHLPVELRLESYLPQNHDSQTQIADGFMSREQLAGWLHLQHQFTMHNPTIQSRLQDFQGQGYIDHDGVVPSNDSYPFVQFPSNISQQGVEAYNMPSSVPMSFDPVPVSTTFANTVLPNLEASRLSDEGDLFGPEQMNAGYIDLVQPCHSQQLATGAISPVHVTQPGHNRTLALNSIYDPMYEALGLPADPHLRLFHASYVNSGQSQRAEES